MEMLLTQLASGANNGWLPVVYVVGAISIAAFRGEHIANRDVFRVSYLAFAAHLLVMPLCNLTSQSLGSHGGPPNSTAALITQVGTVVSQGLFAISIVTLLSSMVSSETDE